MKKLSLVMILLFVSVMHGAASEETKQLPMQLVTRVADFDPYLNRIVAYTASKEHFWDNRAAVAIVNNASFTLKQKAEDSTVFGYALVLKIHQEGASKPSIHMNVFKKNICSFALVYSCTDAENDKEWPGNFKVRLTTRGERKRLKEAVRKGRTLLSDLSSSEALKYLDMQHCIL